MSASLRGLVCAVSGMFPLQKKVSPNGISPVWSRLNNVQVVDKPLVIILFERVNLRCLQAQLFRSLPRRARFLWMPRDQVGQCQMKLSVRRGVVGAFQDGERFLG